MIISCGSTIKNSKEYIIKQSVENKILWRSNEKLKWNDFKGKPFQESANKQAETQCEINILDIKLINNIPEIKIGAFFVKNRSWTITDNLEALNHEQLHFDIYELYTRKIRRKFKELKKLNENDVKEYQKGFDELINEAIRENNNYDNEVYFNQEKQQEWQEKITKELEDLKEYEYIPLE